MPSSPAPLRRFIGAVHDEWRMFSDNPDDYEIGPPIGFGATSIVYSAHYISKDGLPPYPCAVKVVNLDRLPQQSLRLLRRETQLMSLSKHPNVLRVRGSWTTGHNLYIALRLMNAGSAADVMHYGWPGGMREEVVKCILKQALEGLNYLHINGFIHRDVKAANLFIDDDGTVLLGDLGVAASLCEEELFGATESHQRANSKRNSSGDNSRSSTRGPSKMKLGKRKSFVGTPCWMAPEVISGRQYDAKADIWSFGITAIELTQGRAPHSREAPSRVLLKTVQDASPEFARESGQYKFSKSFKEIVESCLAKDPARRPTAGELLETSFFKSAKRKQYLVNTILKDLPPLIHRQERRARASALANPTRCSMSSWDFSIDPSRTPDGHNRSLHSTYFGTSLSYHPQSPNHSQHASDALPNSTRLGSLEEVRNSDVPERPQTSHPRVTTDVVNVGNSNANGDEDGDADGEHEDSHSSAGSSIFDLEESGEVSNPTTPETGLTPVGGLSASPTSLSCSAATEYEMSVQLGNNTDALHARTVALEKAPSNGGLDTTRQGDSTTRHASLLHRRGSTPTTTEKENTGALLALKRIASASGWSSAKASSISVESPTVPELVMESGLPVTTAPANMKGSRWRKLVRSSSGGGAREDDSSSSHSASKERDKKRRSTLGRILERSGK